MKLFANNIFLKKTGLLFFFVVISIYLSNCSTFTNYGSLCSQAENLSKKKQYGESFKKAAESIKEKPEYEKAQIILFESYDNAVNQYKSEIERFKNTNSKDRYDNILEKYEAIQELNDTVDNLPKIYNDKTKQYVSIRKYEVLNLLSAAKLDAAEYHYSLGNNLFQDKKSDIQKAAAKEFLEALNIIPGYKDAEEKYNLSKKTALKRIAIMRFEDKTFNIANSSNAALLTDLVYKDIFNNKAIMEFNEIIMRDDLTVILKEQQLALSGIISDKSKTVAGELLGAQELITGTLIQIIHTPPAVSKKTIDESKEVVAGQKEYVTESGKKKKENVYDKVRARTTVYTVFAKTMATGTYKITDINSGQIKHSGTFTAEDIFEKSWAEFSGDKRAVYKYKDLTGSTKPQYPSEKEMEYNAIVKLASKLSAGIIEYEK
ncbi:MAG TPA: hypothetical protein PKY81_00460 [bacterium]|nr:hypothetical protein [bacterium]HPN29404.1 hypothetical protein [bacterium]